MKTLSICKVSLLALPLIAMASVLVAAEPQTVAASQMTPSTVLKAPPQTPSQTVLRVAPRPTLVNQPPVSIDAKETKALNDKVLTAFFQKDFSALEAMANEFREKESRLPAGEFKLRQFHFAFRDYFEGDEFLKVSSWEQAEALCLAWKQAFPKSAAATIVRARLAVQQAYGMRGTGYSSTVTERGWEGFAGYLQKARDILEADKGIAAADPGWYVTMIAIARSQQWTYPEFITLATEAIERFPNFYQIYLNIVYRLEPEWGGSYEAVETFAQQAAANKKSSEGAAIYARIYADIALTEGIDAYKKAKIDWSLLKQGFQKIVSDFPDKKNVGIFAKLACLQHDKELTLQLLKQVDIAFDDAWHDSGDLYQQCTEWVGLPLPTGDVTPEQRLEHTRAAIKSFAYRRFKVSAFFDTALQSQNYKAIEELYKAYLRDRDVSLSGWSWLRGFHEGVNERLERAKTMDIVFVEGLRDKIDRWAQTTPMSQLAQIESVNVRLLLAKMRAEEASQSLAARVKSSVAPLTACDDLCEANKVIALAISAEPADPFWYVLALRAAHVGGEGLLKIRAIRDQGAKRFPFYEDILQHSLTYMIPHWRGKTLQEATQFVEDAVALTKDRRGTEMYSMMWIAFARELNLGDNFFTLTRADWQRMKKSFEDLIVLHEGSSESDTILLLRFACLANDKETALAQLPKLKNDPREADIFGTGLIDRCLVKQ